MKKETLDFWKGEFGDEYTGRNATSEHRLEVLGRLWGHLLKISRNEFNWRPDSFLEVGANVGDNLRCIHDWCSPSTRLYAVEPNEKACAQIPEYVDVIGRDIWNIEMEDNSVDLVFTSGVLIHIHPKELKAAYEEIYRVANKYIISIEYFSAEERGLAYRDKPDKLWLNDFGQLWLNDFDIECRWCEFFWEPHTGLNNVTVWLMEKNGTG